MDFLYDIHLVLSFTRGLQVSEHLPRILANMGHNTASNCTLFKSTPPHSQRNQCRVEGDKRLCCVQCELMASSLKFYITEISPNPKQRIAEGRLPTSYLVTQITEK